MQSRIGAEIQSLVDLVRRDPAMTGSLRALLVLLRDAPDSSIVADALVQIDPDAVPDEALRVEASRLLSDADAPEMAARWTPAVPDPGPTASNVVALGGRDTPAPPVPAGQRITFEDIGGLEDVKRQIRRKIINPFQNKRALFDRFKRKAGGGVLMYGPPGCGKTMIARALASECDARFMDVRAADVLDQYIGNAEKRISGIFAEARASRPVVLFFDEIEALAQRRQMDDGAKVNTTVSTLLTEMDGFAENNDGMLFLGATNVPWSLDSAFRRPGRFDRVIFVPPPDRVARKFILRTLLEDRPVDPALDVDRIVEKSSGFSGADLAALVETAIDVAIEESESVETLKPLSNGQFAEAFREVRSSVGEWLGQARSFADYANESGMYDDLAAFLKKYAR